MTLLAFLIGCVTGAIGILLCLAYVAPRVSLSKLPTPPPNAAQGEPASGSSLPVETRGAVSSRQVALGRLQLLDAALWQALGGHIPTREWRQ